MLDNIGGSQYSHYIALAERNQHVNWMPTMHKLPFRQPPRHTIKPGAMDRRLPTIVVKKLENFLQASAHLSLIYLHLIHRNLRLCRRWRSNRMMNLESNGPLFCSNNNWV
jgi:hypothetical protein